eukprot:SM000121S25992  [mRNA]  locus=s121:230429:231398:+ [translate_table: standard]
MTTTEETPLMPPTSDATAPSMETPLVAPGAGEHKEVGVDNTKQDKKGLKEMAKDLKNKITISKEEKKVQKEARKEEEKASKMDKLKHADVNKLREKVDKYEKKLKKLEEKMREREEQLRMARELLHSKRAEAGEDTPAPVIPVPMTPIMDESTHKIPETAVV